MTARHWWLFAAAVVVSAGAAAQPSTTATTLALEVGVGHDDNPTLSAGATSAASFAILAPSIVIRQADGGARLEGSLRAEVLRHAGRSELDRANVELGGGGAHPLGLHSAMAWRVTLQDWHDPVGSSSLARIDDNPDHFVAGAAGLVLRQDSLDGLARLEAELTLSRKDYQNHRDVTILGDLRTRAAVLRAQGLGAPGRALWLMEWRGVRADYPFRAAGLSHEDHRVQAGFRVDADVRATTPWTAQAKLGWQRLSFPGLRPTRLAPAWDLQAQWQARADLSLEASAQRQAGVAPGDLADAYGATAWRLGGTWAWVDGRSVSVAAGGSRLHFQYGGFADGENRWERLQSLELSLRQTLSDGWSVSLSGSRARRTATVEGFDHRRHVLRLLLHWSG